MTTLGTALRAAVAAHTSRTGESINALAARCGVAQPQLARALVPGAEPRWQTVAPVLEALGLEVRLVRKRAPRRVPGIGEWFARKAVRSVKPDPATPR